MKIPLCKSPLTKNDLFEINKSLKTGWLTHGKNNIEFENNFKKITGVKYAISMNSCTSALECSLKGNKIKGEVIIPSWTWVSTANAVLNSSCIPVFADVNLNSRNITADEIKKVISKKTKAIIIVHYGGLPCDMDELQSIADEWNIPIIEDAAHALGATYKGKNIGEISDYTMYSFQAIKHITTGDGGMVVIKDKEQVEKAKRLRWFGIDRNAKQKGIWENDITEIGYKYQMTDIAASIGLAGLEEFDNVLEKRQSLFSLYKKELSSFSDVDIVGINRNDRTHASWLFTVLVDNRYELQRKLTEKGIESNQMHFRNDRYSIFKDSWKDETFSNMDSVENKYLVLPLNHKMSQSDVTRVCSELKGGW